MTKTKTIRLFEKTWEGNLLNPYEDAYPAAVERVATVLRPRFESGELRGWTEEDLSPRRRRRTLDPFARIAEECTRTYIKTPLRALAVLEFSAYSPNRDPGEGEPWIWDRAEEGTCLLGAAEDAMAKDVLQLARERGWTKPRPDEHPEFKSTGARARP